MKDRLGVLDGMRGIAVLLVLWYHLWEISWLPAPFHWLQWIPETGFIGVPLFFFLSGFVITFPFVRAQVAGERPPTWGHFAWRRFIKIVPSYLLSIAIAYAIGYATTQRAGAAPWQEVVTHLLFIHTWWQSTYGSINGVLWTLSVEVEFYLVFPLIWWCFSRRPLVTYAAILAIAMAWRIHGAQCCSPDLMPLLVENLPGYIDIFASGMLCAWIFARYGHHLRTPRISFGMPILAIAGLVLCSVLLIGMFNYRMLPNWETALQVYTRPLYGIGFGAIALGSLAAPRLWQVLLANAPLQFMAFISYNLYLYHQMIARLMVTWHIPPYVGPDPHGDPVWQVQYSVLAFVVIIAQATIVTFLFERPLLRLRQPRLLSPQRGHSP